jgi:alcohol dehydrogenase class IV
MTPSPSPPSSTGPAAHTLAPFEWATATRVIFGAGTASQLGTLARDFGRRCLVVTGSHPDRWKPQFDLLRASGLSLDTLVVPGEPTTLEVAAGVARARLRGCDVIIGIGGGSAIDAAKAVAGLLTNEHDLFDYLEVVGRGQPMNRPAVPWIAVPTTAGAGAEVTRNAVLTSRVHRVKASLRSPFLLARIALVDPQLTLDLPPNLTAATGLDALTQLIEPWLCRRANPLTDALCRDGIPRIARSLRRACNPGHDLAARTDLSLAALMGGMALTNAGLGIVHGLAAPLGGAHAVSHGVLCATLLPHGLAANWHAIQNQPDAAPLTCRFQELAHWLTGSPDATVPQAIDWIRTLVRDLHIPTLSALGVPRENLADIATRAQSASSMKANPVDLSLAEVTGVLEAAW